MTLYAVIIAGGKGARFWPLSRRERPKQCLSLDGGPTLLQRTFTRLLPMVPASRVLVVTARDMAAPVQAQLGGLPPENLLVEPAGRNTAPAVALAAAEIARREGDRPAVMLVLPADHAVADEGAFRSTLLAAASLAEREGALVTVGIAPTRPETGFGYLELGAAVAPAGDLPAHRVRRFVEKPDRPRAEAMLASGGHLWNAGLFAFTVEAISSALAELLPEVWQAAQGPAEAVAAAWADLPSVSLDVGVMERAREVMVVPADFGWSDLGSWAAVGELLPEHPLGRVLADRAVGVEAGGNLVFAPGKAVALLGVSGLAVVDAGDALLIVPLDQAQRVRELVDALGAAGADELL